MPFCAETLRPGQAKWQRCGPPERNYTWRRNDDPHVDNVGAGVSLVRPHSRTGPKRFPTEKRTPDKISAPEASMADDRKAHDPVPRETSGPTDGESTVRLLELARGGDGEAVDRLFTRYLRPLQRWASGRLPKWARDLTDTDDLVQETLLQTFRRIGAFEPRGAGALQAYLRHAVLNHIKDELRRKGRRPGETALKGLEVDAGLSPLERAIGQETIDRYERALARLEPEEREAIIARIEMGFTYEELAEALGTPSADAARKRVQRALLRLVEEMDHAAR